MLIAAALITSFGSALAQGAAPETTAVANGAIPAAALVQMPQRSEQNPLAGSVPTGTASGQVLQLSLADAVERGLRQNLGLLLTSDSQISTEGQRWQALSALLPNISARVSENAEKVNLEAQGFEKIASKFPGFPLIVGPFGYFDARLIASQDLLDINGLNKERSAAQSAAAAKLNYRNVREMVVLTVGAAYLQAVAESARVQTVQAEVNTAQALYTQAEDLKSTGVSAGIDVLRSQVEVQTRQQQLIAARNDFAKQKISLARTIGLPLAQEFTITDVVPYEPTAPVTLDQALQRAYAGRADYQSAMAQATAAEYARRAAFDEHLPTASIYADYGLLGVTPSSTRGTYTLYAALRIPIFAGNRAHGDALVAQAELIRSQQQLENLRAQVEQDVRTALLDLQSSSDQVNVAKSNVDLAQQTLTQARDRFSAGATDNIEVVQAQQAVATANEAYISSLYAYNLARVELATATGSAEQGIRDYWKEK